MAVAFIYIVPEGNLNIPTRSQEKTMPNTKANQPGPSSSAEAELKPPSPYYPEVIDPTSTSGQALEDIDDGIDEAGKIAAEVIL